MSLHRQCLCCFKCERESPYERIPVDRIGCKWCGRWQTRNVLELTPHTLHTTHTQDSRTCISFALECKMLTVCLIPLQNPPQWNNQFCVCNCWLVSSFANQRSTVHSIQHEMQTVDTIIKWLLMATDQFWFQLCVHTTHKQTTANASCLHVCTTNEIIIIKFEFDLEKVSSRSSGYVLFFFRNKQQQTVIVYLINQIILFEPGPYRRSIIALIYPAPSHHT